MIFTVITSQCAVGAGIGLKLIITYALRHRMLAYWAYTFSTLESIEIWKNAEDEQGFFKNGVGRFTESQK